MTPTLVSRRAFLTSALAGGSLVPVDSGLSLVRAVFVLAPAEKKADYALSPH